MCVVISSKERLEEIKKQIKLLRGDMSVTSIEVDIDADIILDDMEWLVEQTERVEQLERFKVCFDELYRQGLEVAEWHMNGDLEAFDNFYESAIEHMESESSE